MPAFCLAHDDFIEGSKDREHLSGDDLKKYLHGHSESVRNAPGSNKWHTQTSFWDYDPDIDDPNDKKEENWEASGCVTTDENGKKLYDHDCYNEFIKDGGLIRTDENPKPPTGDKPKPKPKPPTGEDKPKPKPKPPTEEVIPPVEEDTSDKPKPKPPTEDTPPKEKPQTEDDNPKGGVFPPVDSVPPVDSIPPEDDTEVSMPQKRRRETFHSTMPQYPPCVFTSASVEGLQVVEYMTNMNYANYDEEGNLWYKEVYPQWIEVLNTTDETINLKGAVLKYTQGYSDFTGEAEIETDFNIDANSVGLLATLPPQRYRVWYHDDSTEVLKIEVRHKINGAPYYYFNDTHDHDIDLLKRWTLEYNGKVVFDLSTVDAQARYVGESCQVSSKRYSKGLLYYSRLKYYRISNNLEPTPGFYEIPDPPTAPLARRTIVTTWAKLKTRR